ncbi:hypothetical protein HMSSN036_95900 [Paenibacillus macerans]|nr:hypothetical protein HMSSN036_95900 [Paenibacillus macerans]
MPSLNETSNLILKRTVIVAIFAAVAVVLSLVESIIPVNMGVPGAKLGLANIMVLTCLYFLRTRDAFMMVLLKTLLTAFYFRFVFQLFVQHHGGFVQLCGDVVSAPYRTEAA